MNQSLLETIYSNFVRFSDSNAFFIRDEYFTYGQLSARVMAIASRILSEDPHLHQKTIGVVTNDHLDTYASILAVWFTGNIFVPVNPKNPPDRQKQIIDQSDLQKVFVHDPGNFPAIELNVELIATRELPEVSGLMDFPEASGDNLLYLLFTSGSTGVPKGVPISLKNLESFVYDFISYGYAFQPEDRFLQIYDLSFDASVHCYTVPLTVGGCVYTVPQEEIKYLYALKLMQEQDLSFVKMPPSTIAYLRPFFDKIRLEKLKYCLLGGEALNNDLVSEWSACVPNARIQNVYGPTEATINCLIYGWERDMENKQLNGIVSIGKPFGTTGAMVLDGELCVSGDQITPGYWKDPEKDKLAFFDHETEGPKTRFYKTGDMVIKDPDGDYLFAGRRDEQIQIDGFRVELGEIEKHARDFTQLNNIAAISALNELGTNQIHLFVESTEENRSELMQYLESRLPYYMVPSSIQFLEEMPKSTGGKIQKSKLKDLLP